MAHKACKRIHKVVIKRMVDTNPDTSYLGEYSNTQANEFSIDRKHTLDCAAQPNDDNPEPDDDACTCGQSGDWTSREYRYFNPSFNYVDKDGKPTSGLTPEDVRKYTAEDYRRMESLNAGQWCYIGIRAEAEIQLTGDTVQRISSGGLWGIESDGGGFEETEQEELGQLRTELEAIGFSKRAVTAAFKNVEHVNA